MNTDLSAARPLNQGGLPPRQGAMLLRDPDGNALGAFDPRNRTFSFVSSDGKLVTMDLAQGDVHIDSALSTYAAGYALQESFADMVSPIVLVPKASDYFYTWDKDNAFQRVANITVGPGGSIPEVSTKLSSTQFATKEYVLGSFVPSEVEANADAPLRPMVKAMSRIMSALRLAREDRVAALAGTSTAWDASVVVSLAAGQKWNGGASSDPIANINAVRQATLQPITGMLMNRRVWNSFVTNSQVQKFVQFKQGVPGLPGPGELFTTSGLLDLPKNIWVSDMKGKSTSTGTYDYVWPDNVVLVHQPATPGATPSSGEEISSSYTFRWNGATSNPDQLQTLPDGSVLYRGWLVRSFYDPKRGGRAGNMIVCVHNDAEIMTGPITGGLIVGAYQ